MKHTKIWDANFQSVLFYARFFSVIPNYENPREKFNWRALVNFFVIASGFAYSENGRWTLGYWQKPDIVSRIMDSLSYALLTLNGICIMFNCIFRKKLWKQLLGGFTVMEDMISKKVNKILIIYNIAAISFVVYGVYVWINTFTFKSAKYWIFLLYQEYHCGVLIYTIVSVNLQLRKQLQATITNLEILLSKNQITDLSDRLEVIKDEIKVTHDLVKIFNDLLGWQMFFIISNSTCAMLDSLLRCVRYLRSDVDSSVKGNMLIVSAVLVLAGMTKSIAVIVSCDNTVKMVKETEDVCFSLKENCPMNLQAERYLTKIFYFLRNINFNAAGIVDINRSTLFELISVTTTYFIVYMQLN